MTRRLFFLIVSAGLISAVMHSPVSAQDTENREIVSFRLTEWKTLHLHDADAAETIFQTLKNLGCDATKSNHGNHIDVRYRCSEWRSIGLKTHDDAHRWEEWLKGKGFETVHKH